MRTILKCAVAAMAIASSHAAAAQQKSVDDILAEMGTSAIRSAGFDICLPATSEEYEALGKNAVLKITASSAIATELPLTAAYIEVKDLRVPLQRIKAFPKTQSGERGQEEGAAQVSFYLLPISLMKVDSHLAVDFRGRRSGFGITSFPSWDSFEKVPSFIRLDEYDTTGFPDEEALKALLAREYPDYF